MGTTKKVRRSHRKINRRTTRARPKTRARPRTRTRTKKKGGSFFKRLKSFFRYPMQKYSSTVKKYESPVQKYESPVQKYESPVPGDASLFPMQGDASLFPMQGDASLFPIPSDISLSLFPMQKYREDFVKCNDSNIDDTLRRKVCNKFDLDPVIMTELKKCILYEIIRYVAQNTKRWDNEKSIIDPRSMNAFSSEVTKIMKKFNVVTTANYQRIESNTGDGQNTLLHLFGFPYIEQQKELLEKEKDTKIRKISSDEYLMEQRRQYLLVMRDLLLLYLSDPNVIIPQSQDVQTLLETLNSNTCSEDDMKCYYENLLKDLNVHEPLLPRSLVTVTQSPSSNTSPAEATGERSQPATYPPLTEFDYDYLSRLKASSSAKTPNNPPPVAATPNKPLPAATHNETSLITFDDEPPPAATHNETSLITFDDEPLPAPPIAPQSTNQVPPVAYQDLSVNNCVTTKYKDDYFRCKNDPQDTSDVCKLYSKAIPCPLKDRGMLFVKDVIDWFMHPILFTNRQNKITNPDYLKRIVSDVVRTVMKIVIFQKNETGLNYFHYPDNNSQVVVPPGSIEFYKYLTERDQAQIIGYVEKKLRDEIETRNKTKNKY